MGQITDIPHRIVNGGTVSNDTTIGVYQAGTSTPVSLFSDDAHTISVLNPITVNAGNPIPPLYHSFAGDVRVKVSDVGGTIFDDNPYDSPVGSNALASHNGGAMVGLADGAKIQDKIDAYESTEEGEGGGSAKLTYTPPENIYIPRPFQDRIGETLSVFDSQEARSAFAAGNQPCQYAINDMLLYAQDIAAATQRKHTVIIPGFLPDGSNGWISNPWLLQGGAGTSANPGELRLRSNLVVMTYGAHFLVDGNVGQIVGSRGAKNTDWYGGTIDGNGQVNANGIAVSWMDPYYGDPIPGETRNSEKLRFFDVTVLNCRHGGAHLPDNKDPAYVGRGGGKAFSAQNGAKDILFAHCRAYDCDIGVDIGGILTDDRWAQNIRLDNILLERMRYIGILTGSTSSTTPSNGAATSAIVNNIVMREVANGKTIEEAPQDVANLFGVVTFNAAFDMVIRGLYVENTNGATTLKRGTGRNCSLEGFEAHINGTLLKAFHSAPFGGDDPRSITSYGNSYSGRIFLDGSADPTDAIWYNDVAYPETGSALEIQVKKHNNNSPAKISTSKMAANANVNNIVKITDLYDGSTYEVYRGQVRITPEIATSVADDTVLQYRPRNTDTQILVACDTGSTIHTTIVAIKGVRVVKVDGLDSAGNFVVGTTALADGTSDGSDAKYNVNYTGGIVYFKNRIGVSRNVTIRELL